MSGILDVSYMKLIYCGFTVDYCRYPYADYQNNQTKAFNQWTSSQLYILTGTNEHCLDCSKEIQIVQTEMSITITSAAMVN